MRVDESLMNPIIGAGVAECEKEALRCRLDLKDVNLEDERKSFRSRIDACFQVKFTACASYYAVMRGARFSGTGIVALEHRDLQQKGGCCQQVFVTLTGYNAERSALSFCPGFLLINWGQTNASLQVYREPCAANPVAFVHVQTIALNYDGIMLAASAGMSGNESHAGVVQAQPLPTRGRLF